MKFDPFVTSVILIWIFLIWLSSARISYRHLRGNRLTFGRFGLALWWVLRHARNDPDAVRWGRRLLPGSIASQNFLVAGTVGSGKTLIIRLLLQREIARRGPDRFMVYDGKGDMLDILEGMNSDGRRIVTFDPFLAGGARWNIARDVVDDASANQTARILFPKGDHEHQPFFPESVQNLASGIMQVFIELGVKDWRLSHLLYILLSAERIQKVLNLTSRGRDKIADFVHSGETWANIMATMSNRIQDYEIVAALWEHATTEYSLREWARSDSVLVLRKTHTCTEVIDAMNRVLFAIGKRHLLSKPASTTERTWVILDELASFGGKAVSKELGLLLEQGRSRNICCLLGFQNISALRDEFGIHGADRLVDLCSTKALLRFESKQSSDWAAGFFGNREVVVRSVSSTSGTNSLSSSTSYDVKERAVVLPSQFLAFPRTGKRHGLCGYFVAPVGDPPLSYGDRIPSRWLFGKNTLASAPAMERRMREGEMQRLSVTDQDIERLFGGGMDGGGGAAISPVTPGVPPLPPEMGEPVQPESRVEAEAGETTVPPVSESRHSDSPRPAGEPGGRGARDAADSRRSPPVEVWDLAGGVVEPAPSIWQVPRRQS